MQGEADFDPKKAVVYLEQLEELIRRLRQTTDDPSLPFVAGEPGLFRARYKKIDVQSEKLPQAVAYSAVACSKGLKDKGDQTPFYATSAEKYVNRFAKKMKQLQRKLRWHK